MSMRRRTAAYVSLLLLLPLAATALALGCGGDTAGDAAPTVAPLPTHTPLPTGITQPTAVPLATRVLPLTPTATGEQLAAAEPTAIPSPTRTPVPTITPTPTTEIIVHRGATPCWIYGWGRREEWQQARYVRWSPDGSQILFDASVGFVGGPPVGLYGLEVESYELTEIVNPLENTWDEHSNGYYSGPMMYFDISPGGSRIAYSTCRYFDPNTSKFRYSDPNSYEIVVSNIDGTEILRLTENNHVDNYPVWSPDGTRIAFISDRDVRVYDRYPVGRLYTMAPDGSDVRHVTTEFDEGSSFLSVHIHPSGRPMATS